MNELTMWLMTIMMLTLSLVLYLRIDIHDWGMVGFTTVMFGIDALLVRWVLRTYGLIEGGDEMVFMWRLFILLGAPIAFAGYIVGVLRDPPPREQVVARMAVLAGVLFLLTLAFAGV